MDRTDMIFDLSSIWAAVRNVFPYFDRLPFDWDGQYREKLESILNVQDEGEFHRILAEWLESLHDGHTKYIPPEEYREKTSFVPPDAPSFTFRQGVLTIRLNEFLHDHAAYVRSLLETEKDIRLVRLDIRKNIGGNTYYAAKVAELFIPGVFHGCRKWTQAWKAVDAAGASQIARYSEERVQQYIRDGLMTEDEVAEAKSVMGHTRYEHYTDSFGAEGQAALYEGPLEIWISRETMSAAEDFTAMFKSNHRGTLLGEPTFGSTGSPYIVPLRCGGRAQVVSVGYCLLDGTEFIGKGMMPDEACPPDSL